MSQLKNKKSGALPPGERSTSPALVQPSPKSVRRAPKADPGFTRAFARFKRACFLFNPSTSIIV